MSPSAPPVSAKPTPTDGRVRRGIRTHSRIVESLLDLINEGSLEPTAHQIATAAGVSVRTIFQHFSDMEALYGDLVHAQTVRFTPLFESLRTEGDFQTRLSALGVQRRELYELITPIRRVIRGRGISSPVVTERLETVSVALRDQVLTQFAAELDSEPTSDRPTDAAGGSDPAEDGEGLSLDSASKSQMAEVLDLLWSFESWDRLRSAQSLSARQAEALLVTVTGSLLGPTAGQP
ncbi:MAG TPA: TetR/AcrR family transcriptional regulator [Microthrixaceae bacterium]|nr:TetR/AcrR family transcriptional regulator [Microthrixaceae bacterium]